MSDDEIKSKFPLHYLVWKNEFNKLKEILQTDTVIIKHVFYVTLNNSFLFKLETRDIRRTPLMLGIILYHIKSIKVLLGYNVFSI